MDKDFQAQCSDCLKYIEDKIYNKLDRQRLGLFNIPVFQCEFCSNLQQDKKAKRLEAEEIVK